jgi:hypothetical protein
MCTRPWLSGIAVSSASGDAQFPAPNPFLDQPQDLRLAWRVEMTGRIEADEALRAQRAVEQIGGDFPR